MGALAIVLMAPNLRAQNGGDTLDFQLRTDKTVSNARFKPDKSGKRKLSEAAQFFKTLHNAGNDDQFVLQRTQTDNLGITHRLYQQYYKGIPVEGAQYAAHGHQDEIETVNGEFAKVKIAGDQPGVSEKSALALAQKFVGAKKYKWEDAQLQAHMQKMGHAGYSPKGSLVVTRDERQAGRPWRLSWKFTISALEPESEQLVFVDAWDGHILDAVSLLCNTNAPGTAETLYSGTRNIMGDSWSGQFRLRETRNNVNISTLNALRGTSYGAAVDFTDNDNNWTAAEHTANWDRAAPDAHWAAETVLDYWQTVQGRNSINGSGLPVQNYVHFAVDWDNAQWDGVGNAMRYGDGNPAKLYTIPFVALDVVAHEFGHGINQYTANLKYEKEPGALNEGFSDIWGAVIENWADPNKQTWLIGEELGFIPLRSMSNPNAFGQPDTYHGTNWVNVDNCTPVGGPTGNDYCGVHTNSGVLNFMFFLLAQGGAGTNDIGNAYNVSGIGIFEAARIAYIAESYFLTPNSTFADARNAFINASHALYGPNSCESIATSNAWYAVGVGGPFAPSGMSISGPNHVCGTSDPFGITSLPPGAIVTWSKDGPVDIDNPNSNTTTVTQFDYGWTTLTATVTSPCGLNATITSAPIQVGNPYMVGPIETSSNGLGAGENLCNHDYDYDDWVNTMFITVNPAPPAWDTWTLHWEMYGPNGLAMSWTGTNPNLGLPFIMPASQEPGWYNVDAWITNSCGQTSDYYETGFYYVDCKGASRFSMTVYPNPATGGNLQVVMEEPEAAKLPANAKVASSEQITFTLYDMKMTSMMRIWKVPSGQKKHLLNTTGIKAGQYILVMTKGSLKRTQQVLIK
ncbi:hypothetical protein A4H97_10690 [Niastella yeongjuensis]|uniref:Peptidase M4 n=1 Tax=Niastella yeongjuensis TaxID=354355 RepID=A0A1V9EFC4_9BACT|nr:hypothetical protein A4H97_10690 [Niastella yeongjuensis]